MVRLFGSYRLTAWKLAVSIVRAATTSNLAICRAQISGSRGISIFPRLCPVCHVGIVLSVELVAVWAAAELKQTSRRLERKLPRPDLRSLFEDPHSVLRLAYDNSSTSGSARARCPMRLTEARLAPIRHVPFLLSEHSLPRWFTDIFFATELRDVEAFWCDVIPQVLQPLPITPPAHQLRFSADRGA